MSAVLAVGADSETRGLPLRRVYRWNSGKPLARKMAVMQSKPGQVGPMLK